MTDQALDDLVRRVLLDVYDQEYGDVIEELPEHDFSLAFEKKMKKLIHRADHPIRYRVVQAAACILLAALLSGCTVLAISPEARAAFVGWIRETYETWFVYRYVGENKGNSEDISYYPAWMPDGYNELKQTVSDDRVSIIYENNEGYWLSFTYVKNRESVSVYSEYQETNVQTVMVGDKVADLYLDQREGNANTLIWSDEEKGVIFVISAHCSDDELIKIAESVEAQKIPKPQATYRPTWLPEGYSQSLVREPEDVVNIMYASDAGPMIIFAYSNSASSLHLIPQGETELFKVMVNDTPADFYLDNDTTKANCLVWESPENDLIYWIAANLPMDDLIRIAESVQEVPEPQTVYQPTWIPDGYQAVTIDDRNTSTSILYENGEHSITFNCLIDVDAAALYIDSVNADVLHVKVGDLPADLHIDPEENASSAIVWTNEKGNLFLIYGPLSGDELIRMAESVEEVQ